MPLFFLDQLNRTEVLFWFLTEIKLAQKQNSNIMINQFVNQHKFYSNFKKISILYKLFHLPTIVTKFKKDSLFPALKSYIFSRSLQPPLQNLAHQTLSSSKSDSTVNKVVQQIGAASLFSLELLVDGFSITLLPIPFPSTALWMTPHFMEQTMELVCFPTPFIP